MKFIVCGMPRGGTTHLAMMLNAHEQVFCYFMETGLFRYLHLFGKDRPFPAENLQALEDYLRQQFHGTLVDGTTDARFAKFKRLQRFFKVIRPHGLAEPSGPGARFLDERTFEPFLQDVMDLFRNGSHGEELFRQGLLLLGKYFRDVTARPLLGEKTPDNLFFLDALRAADPELTVFCILREPYSTLESMKRRAHHDDRFFDSAFSKEVLGGIANYYQYLRAAYEYSLRAAPDKFRILRFEDLYSDNVALMESVYRDLGLGMTQAAREILPQMHVPTDKKKTKGFGLTEAEMTLIKLSMGEMLEHFGYRHDETREGLSIVPAEPVESVIPLSGIYLEDDFGKGVRNNWMAKEAALFLFFHESRATVNLDMSCCFPPELGLDKVTLRFSSSGHELATMDIDPSQNDFRFELPLKKFQRGKAGESICGAALTIESSASYSPIAVPGLGLDIRDVSFQIRSCTYASEAKFAPESQDRAPIDPSAVRFAVNPAKSAMPKGEIAGIPDEVVWEIDDPGIEAVEVFVVGADGVEKLCFQGSRTGNAQIRGWLRPGLQFLLKSADNGELLATAIAPDDAFATRDRASIDPSRIHFAIVPPALPKPKPGGGYSGDVEWRIDDPNARSVEVHVLAANGEERKCFRGGTYGSGHVHGWLRPGVEFRLRDADNARLLATATVALDDAFDATRMRAASDGSEARTESTRVPIDLSRVHFTVVPSAVPMPKPGGGGYPGDVEWRIDDPDADVVEVYVLVANGVERKCFQGGSSGSGHIRNWLRPGLEFRLKDADTGEILATTCIKVELPDTGSAN